MATIWSRVSSPKDLKSRASGPTSTVADICKYAYPNTLVDATAPRRSARHKVQGGHRRGGAQVLRGVSAGQRLPQAVRGLPPPKTLILCDPPPLPPVEATPPLLRPPPT